MYKQIVILADKRFGPTTSKLANSVIRYLGYEVLAVIDSHHAGKTVQQVLGFGGEIPIYPDLEEALLFQPKTLIIGISPPGGQFPSDWYPVIISAIQNRMDIVSGLHEYLSDVVEFNVLADKYSVKLVDLRKFTGPHVLARGLAKNFRSKIILTVGTHGNVGKMTATIEVIKKLQEQGRSADWLPTGQIGILLKGRGIPADVIKGDFISGAVESSLARLDGNFEYLFVEGQGSLQHMAYSPVSLALLHGSLPDAMILCHRTDVGVSEYGINTDDLNASIEMNERMLAFVKPSKVVGISINTYNLSEDRARKVIADAEKQTGLPVTDPVRYDAGILADALVEYFKTYRKKT